MSMRAIITDEDDGETIDCFAIVLECMAAEVAMVALNPDDIDQALEIKINHIRIAVKARAMDYFRKNCDDYDAREAMVQ